MTLDDYTKYKIIFMHEEGKTMHEISNNLSINRNTVSLWVNRYNDSGSIKRKEGSGRPTKHTNEILLSVQNLVTDNKYFTLSEIKENLEIMNIFVSLSSIRKILNEHQYKYCIPPKRLPLSDETRIARIKFATVHFNIHGRGVILGGRETNKTMVQQKHK
jgi:transposase